VTDKEKIDLWQLKSGAAALATCIVKTMNESDPEFQYRFLQNLERAYSHFRDSGKENRDVLEMLSWTRELLTGWSNVSGQGKPLLE
jgi:hypothetical protein